MEKEKLPECPCITCEMREKMRTLVQTVSALKQAFEFHLDCAERETDEIKALFIDIKKQIGAL